MSTNLAKNYTLLSQRVPALVPPLVLAWNAPTYPAKYSKRVRASDPDNSVEVRFPLSQYR